MAPQTRRSGLTFRKPWAGYACRLSRQSRKQGQVPGPIRLFAAPARALLVTLADALPDALMAARGRLFPWLPAGFGCGIALWFAPDNEPGLPAHALAVLAGAVAALMMRRPGVVRWHPLAVAVLCLALGFLAAGLRAHVVSAPVLGFRYYGPIEGRVTGIDRAATDRIRLTLDRVVLSRMDPARTPAQVRVSIHGDPPDPLPEPGTVVILTGHLAPPSGPAEPDGFDFRRHAWFQSLGAVGYTRTPVLVLAPRESGRAELFIDRLRLRLSAELRAQVPGEAGGFAAAVLTGDRSGISEATNEALRISNLYHIVSISGLHMGMLAGFVFGVIRYGLALVPAVALRLNTRKIAAGAALAAAAFYLALAGRDVATERSFIMVAVMLVAVLFDRRALSLRPIALSALIVLALRPEMLFNPGFQMSYAATVALVTVFVSGTRWAQRAGAPRWLMPVVTLVLSSLIAGAVTTPYVAAHFNRVGSYGLIANLLAVPVMGMTVMPAGVLAAVLGPLGLAAPLYWLMEIGGRWILFVGDWVAGLAGSAFLLPGPPAPVIGLITLGGLWAVLVTGARLRAAALLPLLLAVALWAGTGRPALLVSADGGLLGLMGPGGRALSAPRGNGFSARDWLVRDGDPASQPEAAVRPGFTGPAGAREFSFAGLRGVHLTGREAGAGVAEACDGADLVIVAGLVEDPVPPGCRVIDRATLDATGALAISPARGGLRLRAAPGAGRVWAGR